MCRDEVVVTGIGVVSPIGIGREAFWSSLRQRRSGIRRMRLANPVGLPIVIAGEVDGFDPRAYVLHRKSLKVMYRDAQLGIAAARLACDDARITGATVDPERFGVVLGADPIFTTLSDSVPPFQNCMVDGRFDFTRWGTVAMPASFPLSLLRVLPNMIASHVSIAHDARGPNNTIHHADISGLLAVIEAAATIQRGAADVMIAGGASSRMTTTDWIRRCVMGNFSGRNDDPAAAVRPFDAGRDGQVWGEGAAALIVEGRRHAEARGATILARVTGWAAACNPCTNGSSRSGAALRRVIVGAVHRAGVALDQVGHINAHGDSTVLGDRLEAEAIHAMLPAVPVTAPKSYFGDLSAASGAVEMAVSVLAVHEGLVPPTVNYERPDPCCPVKVVHDAPLACAKRTAVAINWTSIGQATAVVVAGPE